MLPESQVFSQAASERGLQIDENQLKLLASVIERAESGGESDPQTAKNPNTSATGYFQLVNDQRRTSAQSVINRMGDGAPDWIKQAAEPMSDEEHTQFVGSLSREQQETLFMARLFETRGSDKLLKRWIESGYDEEAAAQLYMRIHHTQPSSVLRRHFEVAYRQVRKLWE